MATPTLLNKPVRQNVESSRPPMRRGHIGVVVAGSLIVGLVAALVLVLGVFGGAQEHVISGTALLAFSFGWAMLAVLSVRSTSQPQRWAAAPALFMGLAGVLLLVVAPSNAVLESAGWVWPLLVLALVAWMVVQSRRRLPRPSRSWLLYPVFGVLLRPSMRGVFAT